MSLCYSTDIRQLTAEDYIAAGKLAAALYNDHWLGCEVLRSTGKTEDCTVVVEYRGVQFEVWLESRIPNL